MPSIIFIHPDGSRLAQGGPIVLRIQPLLIKAVPHLVQDREHAAHEIVRVEPQNQPAISRPDGAAAGMDSQIEPAPAAIETSGYRDCFAEAPLLFHWERPPGRWCESWTIGNLCCEGKQTLPQSIEEPSHDPAIHPWLMILDQRIVRLARVAHAFGLVPFQRDDLVQPGSKGLEP